MKQRVQYNYRKKGMKNHMSDERIAKLEAIGFAWVAPGFSQKTRKRKRSDEVQEHVGGDDVHHQLGDRGLLGEAEEQQHLDVQQQAQQPIPEEAAALGFVPPPPDPTTADPASFVPAAFFHTSPPTQPYLL